ncbi:acyl-CoA carboxylase [Bordetella pertussis]|nr:acyl-CoA carboxylase [Bordetella pertussis]
MFKGGAIDVDACNKAISFLVLCDSFNIPLVVKIQ